MNGSLAALKERMAAENYLGFDPGGQTGVALLTVQGGRRHCKTACVDSVDAALSCTSSLLDGKTPEAAGVDTFLFWEPTIGGWRRADRCLRDRYPEVLNSVLASNSTAGAMAVQGMGLAIRLRERWPQIELIETHPKVLYYALAGRKYQWPSDMTKWLLKTMNCEPTEIANEHCWDAAISAWAALNGHTKRWTRDLRALSDAAIEPAGRCAYWWPE